jgi:hypothetical protein
MSEGCFYVLARCGTNMAGPTLGAFANWPAGIKKGPAACSFSRLGGAACTRNHSLLAVVLYSAMLLQRELSLPLCPHGCRVWDMGSGELKGTLRGHMSHVNSVAISPDGKSIVSGSKDMTVR